VSAETSVSVDPQTARLQQIWIDCFGNVLSQVAGYPVTVEPFADGEPVNAQPDPDKPPAGLVFTSSKALQGDMVISTSEAGGRALAQLLVSEPQDSAVPFDQERRDAFEELLRQVLGQVAASLTQVAGGEVEIKPLGNELPAWSEATFLGIRIKAEKLETIELTLIVSPEFAKALQALPVPKAPAEEKAEEAPALQAEPSSARSSNLELLLDVKLDATIRFGQKRMLLREILELHPGIAVALDRRVEEPVELLVGGRVVAHGEVVIVDGNYGLRITEIVSPQQRIESLRK